MIEIKSLPAGCAARRSETACETCGARAFSVCGSLGPADLAKLDALAEATAFAPGQPLAHEGDPADYLFNITSGSVRVYKLLSDGRRQITGFLFAGDFLGLASGDRHLFTAEAIEPSTACRFRRTAYQALVHDSPSLERALLDRARHELAAAQSQMLLLGRKTAQERLASFLLDLPSQDPLRPNAEGRVRLPMTRGEIADYLGLTIETVSRVLTKLKTQGVIRLLSLNELSLERPEQLRSMAEGEI